MAIAAATAASNNTDSVSTVTSDLRSQLQARRDLWMKWAEAEKTTCQNITASHQQALSQEQQDIDRAAQELLAFQLDENLRLDQQTQSNKDEDNHDSHNDYHHLREEQERREEQLRQSILIELQGSLTQQKKRLEDLQQEAAREQARAQDARALRDEARHSSESFLFHLQKANDAYHNHLGLEFVKEAGGSVDQLGFVFTQLDPNNPDRRFSFSLAVGNDDLYRMHHCSSERVMEQAAPAILQALNDDTLDMGAFIRAMRSAFRTFELRLQANNNHRSNERSLILETPVRGQSRPFVYANEDEQQDNEYQVFRA